MRQWELVKASIWNMGGADSNPNLESQLRYKYQFQRTFIRLNYKFLDQRFKFPQTSLEAFVHLFQKYMLRYDSTTLNSAAWIVWFP
jgi:hypothetical protein